ncbi:MAG: POTRA domain-containing protein, partial [Burkholderiaceae bacterium]
MRTFAALFAATFSCGALSQAPQDTSRRAGVDVFGYSIEGSIQLELNDFTRLVSPYIGPRRSPADIERARGVIQQAYRDLGFCTVRVVLARPQPEGDVVSFGLADMPANEIGDCVPKGALAAAPRSAPD